MGELYTKLRVKHGEKILILNPPPGMLERFSMRQDALTGKVLQDNHFYNVVLLFVQNQLELKLFLPEILAASRQGRILWICYPKKTSRMRTDFTRDTGWNMITEKKYRIVSLVSIDETWTAARWKKTDTIVPREKPHFPAIDQTNRKVNLPGDFLTALKNSRLVESFERMPFSHKREYLIEILSAKKPETRNKRIEKAVEIIKKQKNRI